MYISFRYFLPENEPQLYIKWFLSFLKQKRQNNFWTKLAVLVIVQWATACLCIEFFTVTSQPFHSGLYFILKSKSTFLAKDWWFFKDLLTFSKIEGKFIGMYLKSVHFKIELRDLQLTQFYCHFQYNISWLCFDSDVY